MQRYFDETRGQGGSLLLAANSPHDVTLVEIITFYSETEAGVGSLEMAMAGDSWSSTLSFQVNLESMIFR